MESYPIKTIWGVPTNSTHNLVSLRYLMFPLLLIDVSLPGQNVGVTQIDGEQPNSLQWFFVCGDH